VARVEQAVELVIELKMRQRGLEVSPNLSQRVPPRQMISSPL
jgi:hypothetical protein